MDIIVQRQIPHVICHTTDVHVRENCVPFIAALLTSLQHVRSKLGPAAPIRWPNVRHSNNGKFDSYFGKGCPNAAIRFRSSGDKYIERMCQYIRMEMHWKNKAISSGQFYIPTPSDRLQNSTSSSFCQLKGYKVKAYEFHHTKERSRFSCEFRPQLPLWRKRWCFEDVIWINQL